MSKYLFISAHADDCELSCGGAMHKLARLGHEITHIALSLCGNKDLLSEMVQAAKCLQTSKIWTQDHTVREFKLETERISTYFYQLNGNYDFIFTHSEADKHPDHRTTGEESRRIFTGNLLTYITPYNGNDQPNFFVELDPQDLEYKIEALACYKSQAHRPYMDPEFIRAWARYNGIRCGKKYAEGFHTQRLIV